MDTFHELANEGWRVLKRHPVGRPGVVDLIPLPEDLYADYKKIIAVGSGAVWRYEIFVSKIFDHRK